MNKYQSKKSEIMTLFSKKYDEWFNSQETQTDAYDYESSYDKFISELSIELLQKSVGYEMDCRKKKTVTCKFGKLQIPKNHVLCRTPLGFKMTPYWQEKCTFMGQQEVFQQGSETLEKLTGQYVSAKQIERMSHAYGLLYESREQKKKIMEPTDKESIVYGMMDGSMILTRYDNWKEMKLARFFEQNAILPENEHRNFVRESIYVAHLGGKDPFLKKVEQVIDNKENMVWIADGAKWIWNWINDFYPNHGQVLDFFHASEKLHEFAREVFKKKEERKRWTEHQIELLKDNGVEIVMVNVDLITCKGKGLKKKSALLTYYSNNMQRMQYKDYKEKGWLIGSGPMESAHRTVIQQRMKLSGQRWTKQGAQEIVNLRAAEKSGEWSEVKELICNP